MAALGFERFYAAGHDRGARVLHRMCLDHPQKVARAAIIDIIPQHHLYNNVTQGLGDVLLALVLQHPALRPARADDGRRSRLVHQEEARQDRAGPELLRSGGARGLHALLPQSGDDPRDLRGLPRRRRRSTSRWTRPTSRPAARSTARCCCCGARPAGSGATRNRWRSGRAMPPTSGAARRCRAGTTSTRKRPRKPMPELRAFFRDGELK